MNQDPNKVEGFPTKSFLEWERNQRESNIAGLMRCYKDKILTKENIINIFREKLNMDNFEIIKAFRKKLKRPKL